MTTMDRSKDLVHNMANLEGRGEDGPNLANGNQSELFQTGLTELINISESVITGEDSLFNRTGDSDYVPYYLRLETYIVPMLFFIIFVIGVLGNGTLIAIFLKHRTMRNVPNMYICSLAVGDILVILFCVPFTSTVYTVESWPYGLVVCKFSEFIKDISIGVSVFTLTALSADRYFAIVDPMRKLQGRRATRITCITIAGIWIISIVIALPSVMYSYVKVFPYENTNSTFQVCYPFPPELGPIYPKVVVMFKFLVYYAVPLFFISVFYVCMAHHLVLSTRNMPGEAQGQAKQIQSRKKVAKMVLSFVVIFAMCFFPSHVFLLWFYFDPDAEKNYNEFWNVVRIVGFCLSFINSCLNPITLYCVSGTFRKHFNRHLFCCVCPVEARRGGRGGAGYDCVSMSHTDRLYVDRNRNGTQSYRASAGGALTATAAVNINRRGTSTWETQLSASNQRLLTTGSTPLQQGLSASNKTSVSPHFTDNSRQPLTLKIHAKNNRAIISTNNVNGNGKNGNGSVDESPEEIKDSNDYEILPLSKFEKK